MKKKLAVRQSDIDLGERESYCECPIARAVKRAFRARFDREVVVRYEGILVGGTTDTNFWVGEMTPQMRRFMSNFDAGKKVKPTTFNVAFR